MALELVNPCSPRSVSPNAWEGAKDLMRRAGFNDDKIDDAITQLKRQRRKTSRWSAPEINICTKNCLNYYRQRRKESLGKVKTAQVWTDAEDYGRVVFSLHVASAIIETFFSKTKYIQSKTRMRMLVSTIDSVMYLTQTPPNTDVERLMKEPVSIDVSSAAIRTESDINDLERKYLHREVERNFVVDEDDEDQPEQMCTGVIDKIYWSHKCNRFLFHVTYEDDDEEELYIHEVRMFI